ncbi:hypothetical protein YC2023_015316 [Brassica napus]
MIPVEIIYLLFLFSYGSPPLESYVFVFYKRSSPSVELGMLRSKRQTVSTKPRFSEPLINLFCWREGLCDKSGINICPPVLQVRSCGWRTEKPFNNRNNMSPS